MELLPVELIEKILQYNVLSIPDVVNVSITSKRLYQIVRNSNAVWKSKFFQRFPQLKGVLLEDEYLVYYEELLYIYNLKKRNMKLLEDAAENLYGVIDLANEDLKGWSDILTEKPNSYYYLVLILMDIVNTSCNIKTDETISLHTPGNLTQKYYASKALRLIRQIFVKKEWENYMQKPSDVRHIEEAAILVAQWCQPCIEIRPEKIARKLDELAESVRCILHETWPLFSQKPLTWSEQSCQICINAINKVLFSYFELCGADGLFDNGSMGDEGVFYINEVLETGKSIPESLAIVYMAVARRVGFNCTPIYFGSHFFLRYIDDTSPDSGWCGYIDVARKGRIVKQGSCPYSGSIPKVRKLESPPQEVVIFELVKELTGLAREQYGPSLIQTVYRSALELSALMNPTDTTAVSELVNLYRQCKFDMTCLQHLPIPQEMRWLLQRKPTLRTKPDVEPLRRTPSSKVKFAVGMVMYHKLYRYKCVIFNWDEKCMSPEDWKSTNNVDSLEYKDAQPFYNVLVEDDSHRYVAQENLIPIYQPAGLNLDEEVGIWFSHYNDSCYIPNAQHHRHCPDDDEVRIRFRNTKCSEGPFLPPS